MMEDIKDRNQNGLSAEKDRDRDRGRDRRSSPGRRRRSRSPLGRRQNDRDGPRASRRVYVANVPFDVKWSDLKDLFRDKIGNVTYCQLFENEDNKSRGCGLVEFKDSAAARKAIEILHRYEYRGRELVVKEDLDCERDRCGRLILPNSRRDGRDRERDYRSDYDQSVGAAGVGQSYNTYGLSPQFLESLGIRGPLNNRIFVANLDYKVGEHKLEEIFKLAGKVTNVKLYTDATGNSKGHGTVEFEHPVEAVQAISMFHNQKLFSRQLSVRMDKYENDEPPGESTPSALPAGLDGVGKGLGIGGQPLNIQKSMLSTPSTPTQALTALQAAQPSPVPAPTSALSALTNLAGNLQLPQSLQQNFAHSLQQLSASNPSVNPVNAPQMNNPTGLMNNIPGFMNTVDRSLSGLGQSTQSTLGSLSASNPGLGSGLNSFANTAQNVLASLSNVGSQSLGGVSHLQMSSPHPQHNPQLSHNSMNNPMNNSMNNPNNGNVSVYSTYEREFRDDRARQTQISDTVVVRNLPQTFSWQNLRDRFNEIGEVRFAEMKTHGTAIVRFRTDRDAQRAVDLMNGIRIDNRPIEVNIY